jgi:hypothetical protein
MSNSNVATTGVKIGDRVRWESMIGTVRGEVVSMRLAMSGSGALVPWVTIAYHRAGRDTSVELCGTEQNLNMMKFRVNFRNKEFA